MMFYKTILVHIDASRHLEKRVALAAKLALRAHAHLIGVAATGVAHALHTAAAAGHAGGDPAAPGMPGPDARHLHAQAALATFETLARAAGATSCEKRVIDDDAAVAISRQGLYADLIIMGQGGPDEGALSASVDFPEYVVLNSACPVLIVPRAGQVASLGERPLVAWNGSRAASRAARGALPLLQQASCVQLALIDTSAGGAGQDGETAAEFLAFLARHGIKAEVVRRAAHNGAGHGLLSLADELGCDLLVMGCVGHLRSRDMALGGATAAVLAAAAIPVLMSP